MEIKFSLDNYINYECSIEENLSHKDNGLNSFYKVNLKLEDNNKIVNWIFTKVYNIKKDQESIFLRSGKCLNKVATINRNTEILIIMADSGEIKKSIIEKSKITPTEEVISKFGIETRTVQNELKNLNEILYEVRQKWENELNEL